MFQNATNTSSSVTPSVPGQICGSRTFSWIFLFQIRGAGRAGQPVLFCASPPRALRVLPASLCPPAATLLFRGSSTLQMFQLNVSSAQSLQLCLFLRNIVMRCDRVGNVENIGGACGCLTVEEHSGNQSVSNYVSKCKEQIS